MRSFTLNSLVVIDITANRSQIIREDDGYELGEWLDHFSQFPDDYVVWQRFRVTS